MKPFTTLAAVAAPLELDKIDTGTIVPVRFHRLRRRPGHADYANAFLHDLRFDEHDRPRPEFALNRPEYRGAEILVTGADFGCGSSRESAACAVLDYGVRALVGASFGDVFAANCLQNGILPVVLSQDSVRTLWRQLRDAPRQALTFPDDTRCGFEIDPTRKERLLKGLERRRRHADAPRGDRGFRAALPCRDMTWLAGNMDFNQARTRDSQ